MRNQTTTYIDALFLAMLLVEGVVQNRGEIGHGCEQKKF